MASGGGLGGDGYSRGRSMTGIIVTTSPSATSRHAARRGGARFRRQVTSLARRETRGSATRARRTHAGGARAGGALELRPGCAAAAAPDSAQHRSASAIGDGENAAVAYRRGWLFRLAVLGAGARRGVKTRRNRGVRVHANEHTNTR